MRVGLVLFCCLAYASQVFADPFTVTVRTSNKQWAGTDARVYIILLSGDQNSDKIFLDGGEFAQGGTDEFNIEAANIHSPISSIQMGHDNTGPRPGWHVRDVTVSSPTTGITQSFPINGWVSGESATPIGEEVDNRQTPNPTTTGEPVTCPPPITCPPTVTCPPTPEPVTCPTTPEPTTPETTTVESGNGGGSGGGGTCTSPFSCDDSQMRPVNIQEDENLCAYWPGAFQLNGRCVKYYKPEKTWADAKKFCETLDNGGKLGEVRSDSDFQEMGPQRRGYPNEYTWIGGNDFQTEGVWRHADTNETFEMQPEWWYHSSGANGGTTQQCLMFDYGNVIDDYYCDHTNHFYCERDQAENPCAYWPGAFPVNGRCVKYYKREKTWADAKKMCETLDNGGKLAEVRSESDFLQMGPEKRGYTGAVVWIGGNDFQTEGVWRHADTNETFEVQPEWWYYSSGPNGATTQQCLILEDYGGKGDKIDDLECDLKEHFYCERELGSTGPCIGWPGSFYLNGRCFKLYQEKKTWDDAQAYCGNLTGGGGSLAEVRSQPDFQQLDPVVLGINEAVWLGATDREVEGEFVWESDGAFMMAGVRWWTGSSKDDTSQNCVQMLADGHMHDTKCDNELMFVCQYQVCEA